MIENLSMKAEEDVALVWTQQMALLLKAQKELADQGIPQEDINAFLPLPKWATWPLEYNYLSW